jgi:hypothetical protein
VHSARLGTGLPAPIPEQSGRAARAARRAAANA